MGNRFQIYQMPGEEEYNGQVFQDLESQHIVNQVNYHKVYDVPLPDDMGLGDISYQFNVNHPPDYMGRSLSTSDVVVLERDGVKTVHYAQPIGYEEIHGFFDLVYKYYVFLSPVGPSCFPNKYRDNKIYLHDFDDQIIVEGGTKMAWGAIYLSYPILPTYIGYSDFISAYNNPDQFKLDDKILAEYVAIIGAAEDKYIKLPEERLTIWNTHIDKYVPKPYTPHEQIQNRYNLISKL